MERYSAVRGNGCPYQGASVHLPAPTWQLTQPSAAPVPGVQHPL